MSKDTEPRAALAVAMKGALTPEAFQIILAERGVLLVTEERLAAAMREIWRQHDHGKDWDSDAAEVAAIFAALSDPS